MADIRLRHGWLMLAFLAVMFVGAGLMTSQDDGRIRLGIATLLAPLAATAVLLGLFYWKSRRQA